jgi:hypothetical protein
LAKHVAFGMIFAAPLIGLLLAALKHQLRLVTVPVVGCALVAFGASESPSRATSWRSCTSKSTCSQIDTSVQRASSC